MSRRSTGHGGLDRRAGRTFRDRCFARGVLMVMIVMIMRGVIVIMGMIVRMIMIVRVLMALMAVRVVVVTRVGVRMLGIVGLRFGVEALDVLVRCSWPS